MIIDCHNHIGVDKNGFNQRQSAVELKRKMKRYGIDKAVVFPFDENNLIASSMKLSKLRSDSIIPFLRFDPNNTSPKKLRELLKGDAFSGVKLHTRAQDFDPLDSAFYPLYKEISESGKPLIIHTRMETCKNSRPEHVMLLGEKFPEMKLILAHFAGISTEAFDYVKQHENMYVDTSALSTDYLIGAIVGRVGSRKLVFGSDSPLSDPEIELMKVKKAKLSNLDRERILFGNMNRLLDY
ncbi:MAG: amidohydrolase family protein [Candidatus Micrarchaeota archaeon]|nr:amidohydrolase family protein [Candidatus Micrarchaeota archaeon]MDE1834180.1 amidohydrolase family protein [Candidatus Micrarchaeota archaeon]MDE1859700.1 amidohydrolase family protein [Candidatus Micrarchaeota archaeon]